MNKITENHLSHDRLSLSLTLALSSFSFKVIYSYENTLDKIVAQPPTTLCIQFLTRENNDKNNTFPSGKKIFFYNSIGPAET